MALGVCFLVYGRLMKYGIIQGILLAVVFALAVGYFNPRLRQRAILFGPFFPVCGVISGPLLVLWMLWRGRGRMRCFRVSTEAGA